MPRRAVWLFGVVALLAGLGAIGIPFVTRDRAYPTSIPQPTPLYSTPVVPVGPGDRMCTNAAVMDVHSELAEFQVGTLGRPGPPLLLLISGQGYREEVRVPGGYADNAVVVARVRPPIRPVAVDICLRNVGHEHADLYASNDRTHSRSATFVDGTHVAPNPDFAFYEARRRTILERFPLTLRRMSAFRPVGRGLLWPLTFLFLIGVPAAVFWALARALRSDEDDAGR